MKNIINFNVLIIILMIIGIFSCIFCFSSYNDWFTSSIFSDKSKTKSNKVMEKDNKFNNNKGYFKKMKNLRNLINNIINYKVHINYLIKFFDYNRKYFRLFILNMTNLINSIYNTIIEFNKSKKVIEDAEEACDRFKKVKK